MFDKEIVWGTIVSFIKYLLKDMYLLIHRMYTFKRSFFMPVEILVQETDWKKARGKKIWIKLLKI